MDSPTVSFLFCLSGQQQKLYMETKRFISKVLPDGHLSLPEDMAEDIGKVFEVILIPLEEAEIYSYTEALAKEKGFSSLTEEDIERIIHQSRGVK